MSIEVFEKCKICASKNALQINEDLYMKMSYPLICERNNLPYNVNTIKDLTTHHLEHISTPAMAIARTMLHEEAVQLKNTAIETNLALDQVDMMLIKVYKTIMDEEDPLVFHKLVKNFSDLQRRKVELLQFHHKISGKELIDDLRKASLTETVKAVGKELGDDAVKQIKHNIKKKRSIQEFLMSDKYMNELYESNSEEDKYEIEQEE